MKYCAQCGTQIPDSTRFCPKCGIKTSQLQQQTENPNLINYIKEPCGSEKSNDEKSENMPNKNKIKGTSFMKNLYNSLFGFTNIGNKIRGVAKVLSGFLTAAFLIFDCMFLVAQTVLNGIVGMISSCCIILISLLLLFIIHTPLWKLYTWGDIYDSLHSDK